MGLRSHRRRAPSGGVVPRVRGSTARHGHLHGVVMLVVVVMVVVVLMLEVWGRRRLVLMRLVMVRLVMLVMVLALGTGVCRGQGRRVAQRGVRGSLAMLILHYVRNLIEEPSAKVGAATSAVALSGSTIWLGYTSIVAHGSVVRGHSGRLGSSFKPVQRGGWGRGWWGQVGRGSRQKSRVTRVAGIARGLRFLEGRQRGSQLHQLLVRE